MTQKYERWQHHISQIEAVRREWKRRHQNDLSVRPVVGLVKDGDRVYAYGYDALLLGGLLEMPMQYLEVVQHGQSTMLAVFSTYSEADDWIIKELEKIGRSIFCLLFEEPKEENIADPGQGTPIVA